MRGRRDQSGHVALFGCANLRRLPKLSARGLQWAPCSVALPTPQLHRRRTPHKGPRPGLVTFWLLAFVLGAGSALATWRSAVVHGFALRTPALRAAPPVAGEAFFLVLFRSAFRYLGTAIWGRSHAAHCLLLLLLHNTLHHSNMHTCTTTTNKPTTGKPRAHNGAERRGGSAQSRACRDWGEVGRE